VLSTLTFSACERADSPGVQANDPNETVDPTNLPGMMFDGGIIELNENSTARRMVSSTASNWIWRKVNRSDSLEQCQSVEGFDAALAEQELELACTDANRCELVIQEIYNNGRVEFDISMPTLKAPVALNFSVETELDNGEKIAQEQTLCGIAINEAPEAVDDFYLALSNEDRIVSAGTPFSIFANDSDDDDVSNKKLFISEIVNPPVFAETFTFQANGSFRYQVAKNLNLDDIDFLDDEVGILISDGTHSVKSTITIRLIDNNRAPRLVSRIPNFFTRIDDDERIEVEIDFATYFRDVDNDTLRFSLSSNALTESGSLVLSEDGTMRGTITANDEGSELFTITAFDGLETVSDRFRITIRN